MLDRAAADQSPRAGRQARVSANGSPGLGTRCWWTMMGLTGFAARKGRRVPDDQRQVDARRTAGYTTDYMVRAGATEEWIASVLEKRPPSAARLHELTPGDRSVVDWLILGARRVAAYVSDGPSSGSKIQEPEAYTKLVSRKEERPALLRAGRINLRRQLRRVLHRTGCR